MFDLKLMPGPTLTLRAYPLPEPMDVTARAVEYLFDTVEVDPAVTLGDIFRLLEANPALKHVFKRDYAEQLAAEALKGPLPDDDDIQDRLEYLELDEQWRLNTAENAYDPTHRLNVSGIGFKLLEDAPDYGVKAGGRVRFSLTCTSIRKLLDLPVRINQSVPVIEADVYANAYCKELSRANHTGVSLGQVLHGLLFELSFHGGPEEQEEFTASLKEQMAELDAGTLKTVSHDDVFARFDRPGIRVLFESVGGLKTADVTRAMREIPDTANAAEFLRKKLGPDVVVKAEYRELAGRAFRKTFAHAGAAGDASETNED